MNIHEGLLTIFFLLCHSPYLRTFVRIHRGVSQGSRTPCTHCMDTDFIRTYLLSTHAPEHAVRVKKQVKEKIKNSGVIFFPICIEHHWSLFVLCTKSREGAYLMHLNSLKMTKTLNKQWFETYGRHAVAVQTYSADICNVEEVLLHEQLIGKSNVFIPPNPFCHGLPRSS